MNKKINYEANRRSTIGKILDFEVGKEYTIVYYRYGKEYKIVLRCKENKEEE